MKRQLNYLIIKKHVTMEFVKLNVVLEKQADEKAYAKEQRVTAVEDFKVELDLQVATINSEILKQKREISKLEKARDAKIYTINPDLEAYDEANATVKKAQKKLAQWEDLLEVRKAMQTQMV